MRKFITMLFFLFPLFPCSGGIITVDANGTGDYPTIQAAIDNANNGDEISLLPGTYTGDGNRDIDFLGKAITIRGGTGDPNDCVINCQGDINEPHRGLKCTSGEDANSVLEAITITGGYGPTDVINDFEQLFSAGGAVYCVNSSPLINNCIFNNNESAFGGGILNYKSNTYLINCIISENLASDGGGIYNEKSNPVLNNCSIINNSVYEGGGIYNRDGSSPKITNCSINNNNALISGAGIFNEYYCNPNIDNCIISGNTVTNNYTFSSGGGIYNYSSSPDINNCTISYNSVAYGDGGGIANRYDGNPRINGCTINNNTAEYGGGIYNYESSPDLSHCVINENSAQNGGGGMANCFYSVPSIEYCIISNNTAVDGGGIFNSTGTLSWELTMRDTVVMNNSASGTGGGIYNNIEVKLVLYNCTIINNPATSYSGGVYNNQSETTIYQCIVWGNQPAQVYGSGISAMYSDIQGGYIGGFFVMNSEPQFYPGDYHLTLSSPCIDAGHPSYPASPGETDIDGEARVVFRIDMGADEFTSDTSALIVITPAMLDFEANGLESGVQTKQIEIKNYGATTLNWQISEPNECDWLSVSPAEGVIATGESNNVEITVSPAIAGYGTHGCQLEVSSADAENSPQTATVNLEVLGPQTGVNNTSFNFSACGKSDTSVAGQTLVITNTGFDTLNWHIEAPECNWLSVNPTEGQTTDNNSIVELTVDPSKAPAYGNNSTTINIIDEYASNSPLAITVYLYVSAPQMYFNPQSLYIYAEKDTVIQETLETGNNGCDVLHWNIELKEGDWVKSAEPMSGQCVAGESEFVTITVDTNGLNVGDYQTQILISSPETIVKAYQLQLHVYSPNEIHVPGDYNTIREAIDAATMSYNTIIVHPGIYYGFANAECHTSKNLSIRSIDPEDPLTTANTVIYGYPDPYYFIDSLSQYLAIEGLTFKGDWGFNIIKTNSSNNTVIRNCNFTDMQFLGRDAAAILSNRGNVTVENCVFRRIRPRTFYGEYNIIHCRNIYSYNSIFLLKNCSFMENDLSVCTSNDIINSMIYADNRMNLIMKNCTIANNIFYGNPEHNTNFIFIVFGHQSPINAENSIVWGNTAKDCEVLNFASCQSSLTVDYSDVQGGSAGLFYFPTYADITNLFANGIIPDQNANPAGVIDWTENNITIDPCFALASYIDDRGTPDDANDDLRICGDYHLKSTAGRWEWSRLGNLDLQGDGLLNMQSFAIMSSEWQKTSAVQFISGYPFYPYLRSDLDNNGKVDLNDLVLLCENYLVKYQQGKWVYDEQDSACIDAGNPDSDWTAELRPNGEVINMGVYGGTSQASMSHSGAGNIADLDNNGQVDLNDLSLLVEQWLEEKIFMPEDLDRNTIVDFADFAILTFNWDPASIP